MESESEGHRDPQGHGGHVSGLKRVALSHVLSTLAAPERVWVLPPEILMELGLEGGLVVTAVKAPHCHVSTARTKQSM